MICLPVIIALLVHYFCHCFGTIFKKILGFCYHQFYLETKLSCVFWKGINVFCLTVQDCSSFLAIGMCLVTRMSRFGLQRTS